MSCGFTRIHPSEYIDLFGRRVIFLNKENTVSYGAAQVGVATAKSPCGPYTYKSSFSPLGAQSRDMGLYQDGDYHIYLKTLNSHSPSWQPQMTVSNAGIS